jgi:hypothetical protein
VHKTLPICESREEWSYLLQKSDRSLIPLWILDFRFWIVKALPVGSFTN